MRKNTNAFTLLELLIVVGIITVIAIGVFIALNPLQTYNRAIDTQKKADMSKFKKAMEEYYNDTGCYPPPTKLCFTGGKNGNLAGKLSCIMCGTEKTSPKFTPYLDPIPCDPNYPAKNYLYNVDSAVCPKLYRLYANLNISNDPDGITEGCGNGGCGVAPGYGYDYGVTSPGTAVNATTTFRCYTSGSHTCDTCGAYADCQVNPNCVDIFTTVTDCCKAHPGIEGC